MDPFHTPSYLGHQLREIFGSDLPITMLLAIGILAFLEDRYDTVGWSEAPDDKNERKKLLRYAFLWAMPAR